MGTLELTSKLIGDFGELAFEHFCKKNNYAYISLEEIYNTLTPKNVLTFRHGYDRIHVKVPEEIAEELRRVCQPSNRKEHEPSFSLDYLTVSLRYSFYYDYKKGKYVQKDFLTQKAFNWIEVKTRKGKLSRNQKNLLGKTNIPIRIFRIISEIPQVIEVLDEEHPITKY